MPNIFLGIDPGKSGGLAVLDAHGAVLAVKSMPDTERDIADFLAEWDSGFAVIEKVGPNRNRTKGQAPQGSSSMFTFGRNYGFLRGSLVALRIAFEDVLPVKWQRPMGIAAPAKNETSTAKKNRHKQKAQQLWPSIRITHATADALLIAEYARRTFGQLTTRRET